MRWFVLLVLGLALLGCGNEARGTSPGQANGDEPVASEVTMKLSASELADFTQKAEGGDVYAMRVLADYYIFNEADGELSRNSIFWRLEAARHGDCVAWEDLKFMEAEDGHPVPTDLLRPGETLDGIGEANPCAPYQPLTR